MEDYLALAWPYVTAVFAILGIIALIYLIILLARLCATMKSVKNLAADAEREVAPALTKVNPMVDKAELMLDTVNLEMLRVDAILEDVEQITDVAGKTATAVDTVASAPAEAVTSIVDRIRGSLGTKRSNKAKQENLVFPVGGNPSLGNDSSSADNTPTDDEELKAEAQRLADMAGGAHSKTAVANAKEADADDTASSVAEDDAATDTLKD